MEKYTIEKIEIMTREEIKVMLDEFEKELRHKDNCIEQLKATIQCRDGYINEMSVKLIMLQSMIQAIVNNEFLEVK